MDKVKETLCWTCEKSGFGDFSDCPWEREFKPVDGWTAERSDILFCSDRRRYWTESYCVRKCPLYKRQIKKSKKKQQEEKTTDRKSWCRISKEERLRRGLALKRLRVAHGLSQEKFAKILCLSWQTIGHYERGRISYDTKRVAQHFPEIYEYLEETEYEN